MCTSSLLSLRLISFRSLWKSHYDQLCCGPEFDPAFYVFELRLSLFKLVAAYCSVVIFFNLSSVTGIFVCALSLVFKCP